MSVIRNGSGCRCWRRYAGPVRGRGWRGQHRRLRIWIYWENKSGTFAGPKLTLPVAVTVFPKDIPRLPRSWIEDTYSNLIHYGQADKGGRFAALEQP
jgi:hypothetical protein